MRIAIDARMMGPLVTRGIGRYVEELTRAMIAQAPHHQFVLLMRNPETSSFLGQPNVEHIVADVPWYGWREQIEMPKFFREARADLVHVPHWNAPLFYRGTYVLTIHDILLRRQPFSSKISTRHPAYAFLKYYAYRALIHHNISHARHILVPTQFVADELQGFYRVPSSRITITSEGLTDFPAPYFSILDRYFLLPTSYFLYVGSAYPHKRLDLLLDAWQVIAAYHPELSLIIAGEEDVFMARHVAFVKQQNLSRVTFTGRVTDAELAALLQNASAFVFPSSHEGFGLPPLEALSFGTPVISSDSTCLPEVLPKEGVFFFRNGDVNDMIRAVDTLLGSSSQARAAAGRAQAIVKMRYRWSEVAARTLETYERIHFSSHAKNPASFPSKEIHQT
ncbi:MAG: glycosyltransferase family 1 protein [Candidatus Uhrbacteria bacterium]|nr:glycosyltransferase family 1 protein [Candidatus Uhrbacteria bacterium]